MALFKIKKTGEIEIDKELLKLCPLLSELTINEFKYMVVAYDYIDSPWCRKPEEERKQIAARTYLQGSKQPEDTKLFKNAMEEYMSCIYDPLLYTIDQYNTKIYNLHKKLTLTDNSSEITSYDKSISILQKRIEEMKVHHKQDDEMLVLKGKRKLSLLEQWKRNKRLYRIQTDESKKYLLEKKDNG